MSILGDTPTAASLGMKTSSFVYDLTFISILDIHLRNILVKLPTSFDTLSIDQLREEYGEPDEYPVIRSDGKPLPPNVPSKAVASVFLGKYAEEFTAEDTKVLLSDFGEAFAPDYEPRPGEDYHTPLFARPPEALFQPKAPLQLSADIWGLAVAIWEILGMKAIFSSEFATEDKVVSQQIDVLGPIPKEWWERWEARRDFFDESGKPTLQRSAWPPIEEAFEDGVQKYRVRFKQEAFGEEEKAAILHLMRRMLRFRPEERLSIQDVLASDWLVKWAIPAYERCQQR
jgi:serine/threonine-protein kinase SRPK3